MQGTGFFYLNVANEWPLSMMDGLEVAPKDSPSFPPGGLVLKHTGQGFPTRGALLLGPFQVDRIKTPWYRLRALADPLPTNTHLQLFTFASDGGLPSGFNLTDPNPFSDPTWVNQPRDILDVLIRPPQATSEGLRVESKNLWIGALFRSDGQSTPVIRQMRVDYGRDTYADFLPAIYSDQKLPFEFLQRFLSLHESVLGGVEREIADLPRLFDPHAAPSDGFPSWLSWLAGWLAWLPDEQWTDTQARSFLAEAFALYGKRGTVEGLRRYLKIYADLDAHIYEPGLHTSLWSLDETSSLGFTTMLAPASLQGAVLDATATLNQSNLTTEEDLGRALFEDVAHRFCVRVYCAGSTRADALADARAVLDREKPAHTVYDLSIIEPQMRVGSQALVGIDTIVAQGPPLAQLDVRLDAAALGEPSPESRKEK